jgi:uncharacterized protein YkwD
MSSAPAPTSSSDVPAPPVESTPAAGLSSGGDNSLADQVLDLVNNKRARAGCEPVSWQSQLTAAAQGHSDDMSTRSYFSHTTPEGVSFDQRIRNAGYSRPGAENLAKGSTTAAQTMRLWMNSDRHRANILNCQFTTLGVGVTTAGWYWTQDFGY